MENYNNILKRLWKDNTSFPDRNIDTYGFGETCLVKFKNLSIPEMCTAFHVQHQDKYIFVSNSKCVLPTFEDVELWTYLSDLMPECN